MISGALRALAAQRARLCFTSQTPGEFWNLPRLRVIKTGSG